MKTHFLWSVAITVALCGCSSDETAMTYREPLTSPGGVFATLPPAVQNTVRAEVGMAEISRISKNAIPGIYVIEFRNADVYPPLYVASDGSVLSSNLTVVVEADKESIAASTANEASGLRLDDLPPNVVQTIRHTAPTAEVQSISRLTSASEVFYHVDFKDPARHPKLLIREDGTLIK